MKRYSVGWDKITITLVKAASHIQVEPLSKIINQFFMQGRFQNKMAYIQVKQIFKKGSKQDLNNYMPIKLLSKFSKITEKILNTQMYNYLEL